MMASLNGNQLVVLSSFTPGAALKAMSEYGVTVGEIVVSGANTMTRYWGDPDATAEVLRDGWMHTGDAAYKDADGFGYIVNRLKDRIVAGGENVYSTEVQDALAGHDGVALPRGQRSAR